MNIIAIADKFIEDITRSAGMLELAKGIDRVENLLLQLRSEISTMDYKGNIELVKLNNIEEKTEEIIEELETETENLVEETENLEEAAEELEEAAEDLEETATDLEEQSQDLEELEENDSVAVITSEIQVDEPEPQPEKKELTLASWLY